MSRVEVCVVSPRVFKPNKKLGRGLGALGEQGTNNTQNDAFATSINFHAGKVHLPNIL